jgi:N-acylneuraminate cytidylyltransferase
MKNVAFIPVRGGSKSIPLKNIKLLCGRPLVYWTVKAACESTNIDRVYVSTDSDEIKNTVMQFKNEDGELFGKLEVIGRSEESATDTASTEFVMLEFASNYDFENIILIQATSPLLTAVDIDGGFKLFEKKDTDSVISVVRQKRFLWSESESGNAKALNYDPFNRPRRQEFGGYLMENGAFYIISKKNLLMSKNRLYGNIKAYIMPEDTAFEIDEPEDFVVIENLMKRRAISKDISYKEKLKNTKIIVSDFDGVMTDNRALVDENGKESVYVSRADGQGINIMKEMGIEVIVLSTEKNPVVSRRAEKLGIFCLQDVRDKRQAVLEYCRENNLKTSEVAYIGNDVNDLGALEVAGVKIVPSDGDKSVKRIADIITDTNGGYGVIREIAAILEEIKC